MRLKNEKEARDAMHCILLLLSLPLYSSFFVACCVLVGCWPASVVRPPWPIVVAECIVSVHVTHMRMLMRLVSARVSIVYLHQWNIEIIYGTGDLHNKHFSSIGRRVE